MKKSILVAAAALMVFGASVGSLTSCGESTSYEIALVTDVGTIDDHSFNEACWKGAKQYADEKGISCQYYRPSEDSTAQRVATIKNAINNGAKVVVLPGYLFNSSIKQVQDEYPNVKILACDCDPSDDDNNYTAYTFGDNVTSIKYNENEAGFFAGYAAVKEGYRNIGFCGGMSVPAVVKYGQGYLYGADYAAKELSLADNSVSCKYWYSGSFNASTEITTHVSGWYTGNTEVVFSCGGGIYSSVLSAATSANDANGNDNKKVIGVDVDQSNESPLIITSAVKKLQLTVYDYLTSLYSNDMTWTSDVAGKVVYKGVADNAVGLPTETDSWRLSNFTVAQYNAVYKKVKDGDITVPSIDVTTTKVETTKVTTTYDN